MDNFVPWLAEHLSLPQIVGGGMVLLGLLLPPVVVLLLLNAGAMGFLLGMVLVATCALLVAATVDTHIKYVERESRMGKFRTDA